MTALLFVNMTAYRWEAACIRSRWRWREKCDRRAAFKDQSGCVCGSLHQSLSHMECCLESRCPQRVLLAFGRGLVIPEAWNARCILKCN